MPTPKQKSLKVGSVCSGIEAASVSWLPLGYTFSWFSEIADFPSRLLREKYPTIPNLGDMSEIPQKIKKREIETVDIICGGTPCQAFSVAGWQKGLTDDRGNLTLKFVDIVRENDEVRKKLKLAPSIVFWENVEGVLSDKTNAFGCLISSLAGLKTAININGTYPSAGILRGPWKTVVWRVLDAKYFGIPQQRKRLYVIAADSSINPEWILFEKHTKDLSISYPEVKDSISFEKDGHTFELFRNYTDCLYSSYATKWNGNAAANNGSLFVVQNRKVRRLSPLECERLMGFEDGYTNLASAKKSNRYQALGNSWAVPVIKWIGRRILENRKPFVKPIPIQTENDFEYHDFSRGIINIGQTTVNCTEKPEDIILGDMKDIVSGIDVPNIYISPTGCAGILRRKEERQLNINKRLEEVLKDCASKESPEEIEKKSLIQQRGKFGRKGAKK